MRQAAEWPGPSDSAIGYPAAEVSRGVFWVAEDKLLAYPFREGVYPEGVAKSGDTYNHERLWAAADVSGKPFDYYPRGRVHVSSGGKATVYVSPRIDIGKWLPKIKALFGIADDRCRVLVDYSAHYRCHLDDGWRSSRKSGRGNLHGKHASRKPHAKADNEAGWK